jgi:putative NADH-flavin reductase
VKVIVIGANRGVGRCVVEQALAGGHDVTAAVRTPSSMTLAHERLQVVQCDALNAAQVEAAVTGHDAVFVTLGEDQRGPTTLYSDAAKAVTTAMARAGVKRLVFLSNFGVLNERGRGLGQSILLMAVKRMIRRTLDDHRRALDVMRASALDWTAVRAMPLTNGPATGVYRIDADALPPKGASISRADVAGFMLREAERRDFVRRAPAIAY